MRVKDLDPRFESFPNGCGHHTWLYSDLVTFFCGSTTSCTFPKRPTLEKQGSLPTTKLAQL